MTALKLALFDCDGTLVDSQASIMIAMEAAFGSCSLPVPDRGAVRRVVGLSLPEAICRLVPEADGDLVHRLATSFQATFMKLRQATSPLDPLYPGVVEALSAIEDAGVLLGIVTGKSRKGLVVTLESHGLSDRFVALRTADDGPGKPHPAMVLSALEEVGAAAEDTVVIGDTVFDVEMALAAGTQAIGVAWGYHDPGDLQAAGAALLVETADRLPGAVAGLLDLARLG